MGLLNLEEQLSFYRKYHTNTVNVAVHMLFVPLILMSTLSLCTNIKFFSLSKDPSSSSFATAIPSIIDAIVQKLAPHELYTQYLSCVSSPYMSYINLGVLGAFGYGIFYSLLDPLFGIPTFGTLVFSTLKLTDWTSAPVSSSTPSANYVATVLMSIGWVAQFISHGVFEGRAPALFDNLTQALVLAPFFVLFEFAALLGFRTEILERIDEKIRPELEAFRASRNKKNV